MVDIYYEDGTPVPNPNPADKNSPKHLSYHVDKKMLRFLDAVKKQISKNDKDYVLLMDGYEGCLSGDTEIQVSRGKLSRRFTIKRLYNHYNNNPDKIIIKNKMFNLKTPSFIRAFDGTRIRLHKLKNVMYSGKKQLYRLQLKDGRTINATSNHKFLTRNGWKPLEKLRKNEEVMCDTLNPKINGYANFSQGIPDFVKIKSITKLTIEDTYDIECEEPYHNFVANGIIVHNSGKSTFAQQMGTYVNPTLDLSRICMTADEFKKAILNAKKGDCVIYDEAVTGLSAGESITRIGRLLKSLMMQMRQKNLFVIIILPSVFEFNKYAVLSRARSFFHTYENKTKMGYWFGLNRKDLRQLYLKGKKTHSYTVRSRFKGRFYGKYTVNDEEYRKKKEKALEALDETDGKTGESKNGIEKTYALANLVILLKKYENKSMQDVSNELQGIGWTITREGINHHVMKARKAGKLIFGT